MYVKYCENKPKSEYIVAEYLDSVFNVSKTSQNHQQYKQMSGTVII